MIVNILTAAATIVSLLGGITIGYMWYTDTSNDGPDAAPGGPSGAGLVAMPGIFCAVVAWLISYEIQRTASVVASICVAAYVVIAIVVTVRVVTRYRRARQA